MTTNTLPDIGTPTTDEAPARLVWRQQYDFARDAIEQRLSDSVPVGDSMTEQHHGDATDLNLILRNMGVSDGSIIPTNLGIKIDPAWYGDFSNAVDLQTALNQMQEAERRFMTLPAQMRALFENKWYKLHEWVNDPTNLDEAIKLRMLSAPPDWIPPDARKPPIPTPAPSTAPTT